MFRLLKLHIDQLVSSLNLMSSRRSVSEGAEMYFPVVLTHSGIDGAGLPLIK